MAENFDLIFGSSASQSYSWNDSDYQNGWQTVGDTPPTREQFDALQRRADLKAQELNNALTPLVNKSEADGRQASTAYTAGKFVTVDGLPNGWLLECVVGGTSGANAISIPATLVDGTTIVDGDVTWKLRKIATEGGLGYRQPSTTYAAGAIAYHASLPTGYYLECTTGGTTGSGDITPTSVIGSTMTDGTVTWTVNRDLPLFGGGALTGNKLTWNGADLGGASIVAQSLGANGYVKYSNGLIMQWVHQQVSGSATIAFPISFTSAYSYSVLCQNKNDTHEYTQYAITSHSASNITVNASVTGSRGMNIFAIGY